MESPFLTIFHYWYRWRWNFFAVRAWFDDAMLLLLLAKRLTSQKYIGRGSWPFPLLFCTQFLWFFLAVEICAAENVPTHRFSSTRFSLSLSFPNLSCFSRDSFLQSIWMKIFYHPLLSICYMWALLECNFLNCESIIYCNCVSIHSFTFQGRILNWELYWREMPNVPWIKHYFHGFEFNQFEQPNIQNWNRIILLEVLSKKKFFAINVR